MRSAGCGRVLFGLVVWMFIRSRRQLRSRGARWLLYAQDRMATLSTNSSHRAAKDTTHASLLYDETDSAAGSQAILDVVRSVVPVRRWCRSDAVTRQPGMPPAAPTVQ